MHGQSCKKLFGHITLRISVPKISLPVFFSTVALADVGTPYMGISPGRTRPCTHRAEQEQELHSSGCTAAWEECL